MEFNIPHGKKGEMRVVVDETNTAKAYGSGLIDVFATPAMIALMECTAHSSIQEYLPDGYVTVGTEVNAKHIKATPMKDEVVCNSVLESQEGKKLFFTIEAFDSKGKIGECKHTRYIVEAAKFIEKLNQ